MSDTILRKLLMLRKLSRSRKTDTTSLQQYLEEEGYKTTTRTIQRDLKTLAEIFPLECDEIPPQYGWSWGKDCAVLDLPVMEPNTALTYKLIEHFLQPYIPVSILEHLKPQFKQADKVLSNLKDKNRITWLDQIAVASFTQPLLPPEINPDVLLNTYEGLLQGQRLQAKYKPREQQVREYEINPLGLVLRGNLTYLVGCLWEYDDIKQFALHRFEEVILLHKSRKIPDGFNLNNYLKQGEFCYPMDETEPLIKFKARFTQGAAIHLRETKLSQDQMITDENDDWVLITATVLNTQQLRWWILSFGDGVEVLEPEKLRHYFIDMSRNMSKLYTTP